MKIEKINNIQIKVSLDRSDLEKYNISGEDLIPVGKKAEELYQEMILLAAKELDFEIENVPLMVETVHLGNDDITLIVSKIDEKVTAKMGLNMLPMALKERLFAYKRVNDLPEEITFGDDNTSLYSFVSLDDVIKLCCLIKDVYYGESTLYKQDELYYLALADECVDNMTPEAFNALINEFGTKHISNAVSKAYLDEHTEVIIKRKAVEVLASL